MMLKLSIHSSKLKYILINLGKSLGKGTFGKVKLATHTLTGEKVRRKSHSIKDRSLSKYLRKTRSKIRKMLNESLGR